MAELFTELNVTLDYIEKELAIPHSTASWCFIHRLPYIDYELYTKTMELINKHVHSAHNVKGRPKKQKKVKKVKACVKAKPKMPKMREVVVRISDEYYELLQSISPESCPVDMLIIKYGTLLPENHGRLIDADSLFSWFDGESRVKYPIKDGKQYDTMMIYEIFDEIDNAPTIIEGMEGKE